MILWTKTVKTQFLYKYSESNPGQDSRGKKLEARLE